MTETPADDDEWVDIEEAARLTGLTKRTLNRQKAAQKVETKEVRAQKLQGNHFTLFRKSTLPLAKS